MINTYAKITSEVSALERINAEEAFNAALEGIVLLKNDSHTLPLQSKKIALYGDGAVATVKGGCGSGEVNCRYNISIYEGLKQKGFDIVNEDELTAFSTQLERDKKDHLVAMRKVSGFVNFSKINYVVTHPFKNTIYPPINREQLHNDTNTCVYVVSRQAGEDIDRKVEKGDYLLTDTEISNLTLCASHYDKTVLVINVGGYVDLSPVEQLVDSIVFFAEQGQEGGRALASILCGEVSPSAHLTATWPKKYEDIPFANEFSYINGDTDNEYYKEGIYVGYRYFDTFNKQPLYPFGYGLSYTEFAITSSLSQEDGKFVINCRVDNLGKYSGKEVVQVYVSCPDGKLEKEYQRLVAFSKTSLLKPKDSQEVKMSFDLYSLASYDETTASYVIEKGDYVVRVGNSSRSTVDLCAISIGEDIVYSKHEHICPRRADLCELRKDQKSKQSTSLPTVKHTAHQKTIQYVYNDYSAYHSNATDGIISQLTTEDKVRLCVGDGLDIALPRYRYLMAPGAGGYTTIRLERKKLAPSIAFADGPAGLRLFKTFGVKGKKARMITPVMEMMQYMPGFIRYFMFADKKATPMYQFATAFPVSMSLAQSWNTELVENVGKAVQREMAEFGIVFWLAPAMNIYRNPLCGRVYEYYSEDPVLSGLIAAAMTKGVQSVPGYYATLKHYAVNNQETNRMQVSENLSERALREIYLKNFETAIRTEQPGGIMTSYNKVNGEYATESYDLITKVLRNEFGFENLVMTDWFVGSGMADAGKFLTAGGNIFMPGGEFNRRQVRKQLSKKYLTQECLARNASYVLKAITQNRTYDKFIKEKE